VPARDPGEPLVRAGGRHPAPAIRGVLLRGVVRPPAGSDPGARGPPRGLGDRGLGTPVRLVGARNPVLDRVHIPGPAAGPGPGRQAQSVTHFPSTRRVRRVPSLGPEKHNRSCRVVAPRSPGFLSSPRAPPPPFHGPHPIYAPPGAPELGTFQQLTRGVAIAAHLEDDQVPACALSLSCCIGPKKSAWLRSWSRSAAAGSGERPRPPVALLRPARPAPASRTGAGDPGAYRTP
jgi:hypothetical protein